MIRFVHFFNYAEGVSVEEGESWYLERHVPEARKLPGLVRYCSWRGIDPGIPYPGSGAPTPFDQFVRRSELIFEDLETGLKAVTAASDLWKPSAEGSPGFREFECMFLEQEPQFNLLRDAPQQQYKYMTMPVWWPKGRPEADETAEIFVDTYCLAYRDDVSVTDGEDWYLGHHTREGKQLPGMMHYQTWKAIPVPEDPGSPINPNKWYRLTELGMNPETYRRNMVHEETRINFTQSHLGRVMGSWMNIGVKLDQPDEFLS